MRNSRNILIFIILFYIFYFQSGSCENVRYTAPFVSNPVESLQLLPSEFTEHLSQAENYKAYENAILPFSEYQKTTNDEKLSGLASKLLDSNEEDITMALTPRIIYLPSFRNANASHISFTAIEPVGNKNLNGSIKQEALFSNAKVNEKINLKSKNEYRKNPIRAQSNRKTIPVSLLTSTATFPNGDNGDSTPLHNQPNHGKSQIPASIYSTSSTREPLQYHKSVFRSKLNNEKKSLPDSESSVGRLSSLYAPMSNTNEGGLLASMFQPLHSSLSNPTSSKFSNIKLLDKTNESAFITRPVLGGSLPRGKSLALASQQQFTRHIVPAPYSKLSAGASDSNIVNSIFSQSQVRHSPQTLSGLNAIVPAQSFTPQLGSAPFDIFGGASGANAATGANGAALNQLLGGNLNGFNPLQLLGQGSTLDQISRIAKNLLAMSNTGSGSAGSENSQLLSSITKAIGSRGPTDAVSKLTSTAISQPTNSIAGVLNKEVGALIESSALNSTSLSATSTTNETLTSKQLENIANNSMQILSVLPSEQRSLLEAAIKNGEVDGSNLGPSLSALLEQKNSSSTKLNGTIRGENKLMEWIQQNRPRTANKEILNSIVILAADKLPYYGRYCGTFVAQGMKQHNIAGAVWAADNRRLIVSKFNFHPGSRTENISFWAGPKSPTGTTADVFPSENGFFLNPKPIDIQTFMIQQPLKIPAKIRQAPFLVKSPPEETKTKSLAAEAEEMVESEKLFNSSKSKTILKKTENANIELKARAKRNLYEELYNTRQTTLMPTFDPHFNTPARSSSIHFTINPSSFNSFNQTTPIATTLAPYASGTTNHPSSTSFLITGLSTPSVSSNKDNDLVNSLKEEDNNKIVSLDWYAGFQPLLLVLPENFFVNELHWVSLYDHNKKEAKAYVLIPNGVAFQIPSIVQLRPLAPNPGYQVKSGAIKILDTKTIEVSDFSLTARGAPVWFMVGKELLPNANGHIVPLFNKATKEFDCTSLQDYQNETLTLRLPGSLEIRDVFWFSVFSIPQSVSFAHMHLPYNEIHSPPDLLALNTPQCIWKKK